MRCQIGLRLNPDERKALADYADKNKLPSLSAALRHALPPGIFENAVLTEGRPLGYSPKRPKESNIAP